MALTCKVGVLWGLLYCEVRNVASIDHLTLKDF